MKGVSGRGGKGEKEGKLSSGCRQERKKCKNISGN